ncbi:MAG: ABC transporter permease subunit [Anaerolineales bacterium]
MFAIMDFELRRYRGQIIAWGLVLFLLGLMVLSFYPTLTEQQDMLQDFIGIIPEEMQSFFGDFALFGTPQGFLDIEFFSYMPVVLGIFAFLAGSGMLVADEESGRLDLIMAHPVSRSALMAGRLLAYGAAAALICAIGWLGLVLPILWWHIDVDIWRLPLAFLPLWVHTLLFGALALLLSLGLPSRRAAAMASGVLLVMSFFVRGLSEIFPQLETVAKLSPMTYYQGAGAMEGVNLEWLAGVAGSTLVITLIAWRLFQRRDIRVGGEAGWGLREFLSRRGAMAGSWGPPSRDSQST